MDYEKKYQEALERARQFSEHPLQEDSSNIVEYIFPELKESEDEKIRKEMIAYMKQPKDGELFPKAWISYLEKQGEQKPVEWSEDDEGWLNDTISFLEEIKGTYEQNAQDCINWLKTLRPHPCWQPSEEMIEALYRAIPGCVKEKSEDEILLDKLYQGLKYGIVLK